MDAFWKKLSITILGTVLGLVVFCLIVVGVLAVKFNKHPDIEKHSWLLVDLYGEIHEYYPPGDLMGQVLGGEALVLQDVLDGFAKAALDERIEGVILKLSSTNNAGWAKLQEIRGAVDRLQEAGKKVYAWGDAFDLKTLYLAATCDGIYMPAGGYLQVTGLAVETEHVRGTLDKLGIVPHLDKIRDYKTAAELLMNKQMSPAAREMGTWMLDDTWAQVVPTLAAERGLSEEKVSELMSYAIFMPEEAAAAGLIDEVIYWQELTQRLKPTGKEELPLVSLKDYGSVSFKDLGHKGEETIAVVHAQGFIGGRDNKVDPLLGVMMGHESIIQELQRCRKDKKVKAVVFRVDSRGGEGLASDLIGHEVELLAEVKPVIVSMVDVAASGGYYIAYEATKLMADPLTRTGSIGSISGFFDMKGLYDKLGVTKDFVTKGPMARLGSDYREPTPAEWDRFVDAHWKSFSTWMYDVGAKRGISREEIEKLALGRVFTGQQAVANGLIDEVGDLQAAVRLAAEQAGIAPETSLRVVHLPEKKGLLASLTGQDKSHDPVAAALRWQLYRTVRHDLGETARFLQEGAVDVSR
jgi:protease-4